MTNTLNLSMHELSKRSMFSEIRNLKKRKKNTKQRKKREKERAPVEC